mmetsp:Transcript_21624/g.43705  ORF Transcript_21624/g.43705 Transcript_21624/m.43705 type:complete len:259 (-) Transcript_21624:95-871(-)
MSLFYKFLVLYLGGVFSVAVYFLLVLRVLYFWCSMSFVLSICSGNNSLHGFSLECGKALKFQTEDLVPLTTPHVRLNNCQARKIFKDWESRRCTLRPVLVPVAFNAPSIAWRCGLPPFRSLRCGGGLFRKLFNLLASSRVNIGQALLGLHHVVFIRESRTISFVSTKTASLMLGMLLEEVPMVAFPLADPAHKTMEHTKITPFSRLGVFSELQFGLCPRDVIRRKGNHLFRILILLLVLCQFDNLQPLANTLASVCWE